MILGFFLLKFVANLIITLYRSHIVGSAGLKCFMDDGFHTQIYDL
ncbi:hypothetical protein C8R34_103102 [Nitrosomonas sp. Nm84]|nr:hypothetical protein C8R34_103102 [Nitrosomonas sp. Nm84]